MTDRFETGQTPYDRLAYPSVLFPQTHPDRLAVFATLHGLSPAPIETARVLEIGAGDAMSLLAFAAACPRSWCVGFDLAATAVARGRARAAAAGLDNVRLDVLDIMDARGALDGPFDYIIAHGLLAWLPPAVASEMIALIGALLAPDGVAFISYNTRPGGHFRMAVRDLMRHFVPADADPAAAIRTARDVLAQFVEPQADDGPVMAAYRHQAARTLEQPDGLLFHDELGETYCPQLHSDVCTAAASAGLIYLADPGHGWLDHGFLDEGVAPEADVQAQIVRLSQARDFMQVRYFRRSLFVRSEARPRRILDPGALRGLWASTRCQRDGDGWRGDAGSAFAVKDAALDSALEQLAAARPGRLPVAGLVDDDDRRRSLLQLFDRGDIVLHMSPAAFTTLQPERPVLSPLARAMIAEGLNTVCTLDHSTLRLDDPALRAFFAGLDGSRGAEELAALARQNGFADPSQWPDALALALRKALIMRPETSGDTAPD